MVSRWVWEEGDGGGVEDVLPRAADHLQGCVDTVDGEGGAGGVAAGRPTTSTRAGEVEGRLGGDELRAGIATDAGEVHQDRLVDEERTVDGIEIEALDVLQRRAAAEIEGRSAGELDIEGVVAAPAVEDVAGGEVGGAVD